MGNQATFSTLFGIIAFSLLAIALLQPSQAHAGVRSELKERICARQDALNDRLPRPLVGPRFCKEPEQEPTVTLSADPQTITDGDSSELSWSSTNATSCTASMGWSGSKSTSGSEDVSPIETTTYKLTCTGDGGEASDEVTVIVEEEEEPEEPTLEFTADPTFVREDSVSEATTTLTWDSTNADSCTASGAPEWTGSKAVDGSDVVTPTATTTYQLICTGAGGSVTATTTVRWGATYHPTTGSIVAHKITDPSGDLTTFVLHASGTGTITFAGTSTVMDGSNRWFTATPGTYSLTEDVPEGWVQVSNECTDVTIAVGEEKHCYIRNSKKPKLTVTKIVVGGTKVVADFPLFVDDVGVASGAQLMYATGTRVLSETNQDGYTAVFSGDCDSNGNVTLSAGDVKNCTITNTFNDEEPTTGHLIVDKVTVPSGSGTIFHITASGDGTILGSAGADINDATNVNYEVEPGTYSVSEDPMEGWVMTENTCDGIEVAAGETENCTITNSKLPTLALQKTVVNDDSGEAEESDFQAKIDGGDVTWDTAHVVAIGAHTASETNLEGYGAGDWGGDCNTDGTITLAAGEDAVCTITNDDVDEQVEGTLVISEVLYDTGPAQGVETGNEWFEIYNGTNGALDLGGYFVQDNSETFYIPEGTMLASGASLLITGTSTTAGLWSIPGNASWLVFQGFSSQLANGGDVIELFNTASSSVDAVSWGTNFDGFDGTELQVGSNSSNSIGRIDRNVDTGTAVDWQIQTPNPGQ